MHPELFPGLGWPIHSYGLMLVVGFYTAFFVMRRLAKKDGVDPNVMIDILLVGALMGIVGARIFYVIQYNQYVHGFWDYFAIWKGGLVFYGGLIAATAGVMIFLKIKKLPIWKIADIVSPALMVGLAMGRIGCFLNGCCWGAVAENYPLAVTFPRYVVSAPTDTQPYDNAWHYSDGRTRVLNFSNTHERFVQRAEIDPTMKERDFHWWRVVKGADGNELQSIVGSPAYLQHLSKYPEKIAADAERSLPVHPTQLYESFGALAIAALLLGYRKYFRRNMGETFAMMGMLYAILRFTVEGFRVDTPSIIGSMSMGQVVSLPIFAAGIILYIWSRSRKQLEVVAEAK